MTRGPFVHNLDPVIGSISGLHLWWYGASYTIGFIALLAWMHLSRLDLSRPMINRLCLFLFIGILLGARLLEVFAYEWKFYGSHPGYIPAVWLGGMSTHGILLGAVLATVSYCRKYKVPFLSLADELVIPGAVLMGLGRLGNFVDGQIVGSVTEVWWAVKFPDAAGFRHPVVLYDGLKNLLLVPLLLLIRRRKLLPGIVLGNFLWLYGFFRIFVDYFREYPVAWHGLPPGQWFNISMSIAGIVLIIYAMTGKKAPEKTSGMEPASPLWVRPALALIIALPLIIPSDWTQDIPGRYAKRHPGLNNSIIYPSLAETTP